MEKINPELENFINREITASVKLKETQSGNDTFIYKLFHIQCVTGLQLQGWTQEQQRPIVDMQFKAHEHHHANAFSQQEDCIIFFRDKPVGRVIIGVQADGLVLADICLLPDYRGKGIAGAVIRHLQERCKKEKKRLELHVYKTNPAVRLYEHLGFKPAGENELMFLMVWDAV